MRLDSPFGLAIAGTLAIHTLLLVGADAVTLIFPPDPSTPTPRIELIEIEVPPPPEPEEPPPPPPEPEPPPEPPPPEARPQVARAVQPQALPPPPSEPPPPQDPAPDSGGAPILKMPDIAPSAHGLPIPLGPRPPDKTGRGGSGGGSGAGEGSGAGAPPPPVSIAEIKTRALPRGDYGHIDLGKDYPPKARRLGIEGAIRVRLTVDDRGKVRAAVLLNRLGHGLDELALSRARQIEFEPAKDTDDRPVSSLVVWTFTMTLPK